MRSPLSVIVIASVLTGCFGSTPPAPTEAKPKEIPTSLGKPSELTEEELIFRAKRYYEVGLYSESRENFDAIKSTFPLGPYGEFAEIKSADAVFDSGSYADAAKAYDEFIHSRPVSEALPYVLFRCGRSYQLSQRGIGRDMTALDRAQEKYEELLKRFPDSRHAWAAKDLLATLLDDKAKYAESIRDFYAHQGKKAASESRAAKIDTALVPLVEAARARAGEKDQTDQRLTQLASLRTKVESQVVTAVSHEATNSLIAGPSTGASNSSRYRIVKAECQATESRIQAAVFLNKEIADRSWLSEISRKATWKLPEALAEADLAQTKCGNSGATLKISPDGSVELGGINTARPVVTTTLPNPPRLLILAAVQ